MLCINFKAERIFLKRSIIHILKAYLRFLAQHVKVTQSSFRWLCVAKPQIEHSGEVICWPSRSKCLQMCVWPTCHVWNAQIRMHVSTYSQLAALSIYMAGILVLKAIPIVHLQVTPESASNSVMNYSSENDQVATHERLC